MLSFKTVVGRIELMKTILASSPLLRLSRYHGAVDRVMGWACAVDCVSDYPYNYAGILTVNTLSQSLNTTKYVLQLATFIHTPKYEIIQQTTISSNTPT